MEGLGDGRYSVVREQERAQAAEEGDVPQDDNRIVCEIYTVMLILAHDHRGPMNIHSDSDHGEGGMRTLVIPRFSMAGMVYPVSRTSSKPFGAGDPARTSEVELPLFYWVERGGNGLDELWSELHRSR